MTQTAIFTGNYIASATISAPEVISLAMHFDLGLYGEGDGGQEALAANLKNLNPAVPFQTADLSPLWYIDADFGAAVPIDLIALIGHNVGTSGKHVISLANSADHAVSLFSAEIDPDGSQDLLVVPPATVTARYLRLVSCDPEKLYLHLSMLGVWQARTFEWGTAYGASWTPFRRQGRQEGGNGSMLFTPGGLSNVLRASIPDVLIDEVSDIIALSNGEPVLFTYDWTRDDLIFEGTWIYGLPEERQERTWVNALTWSAVLTITELPAAIPADGLDLLANAIQTTLATEVSSVDLGSVEAGEILTPSVKLIAPATNPEPILASITPPPGFELLSADEVTLKPGQSHDILLRMQVSLAGSIGGDLVIEHDAVGTLSPIEVPVTGTSTGTPVYHVWAATGSGAAYSYEGGSANLDIDMASRRAFTEPSGKFEYNKAATAAAYRAIANGQNKPSGGKRYVEITRSAGQDGKSSNRGSVVGLVNDATYQYTHLRFTESDADCQAAYITSKGEIGFRRPSLLQLSGAVDEWAKDAEVVIGFAIDIDLGKVWFRVDGVWVTGAPGESEPAATLGTGQAWKVRAYSTQGDDHYWTLNGGQEAWAYDPPDGYAGFYSLA